MTPFEFLREEIKNVKQALSETLRFDYGPERSDEYFKECNARLSLIENEIVVVAQTDLQSIAALLNELEDVMLWISLIERSHLGEFSWPFSEQIRRFATTLLSEPSLRGNSLEPIIHIIAGGEGYWIFPEPQVSGVSSNRRFMVVAFPRQLKHHVLYHSLIGHELGHTALTATVAGRVLNEKVIPALTSRGPLENKAATKRWLNESTAPKEVKAVSKDFDYHSWLIELICDLFGLLLFGPGYLAAHRSFLGPHYPNPYIFSESHPLYAARHKMLVQTMHNVGWDKTVSSKSDKSFYNAENELLKYLLDDPYDPWACVFDDAQLDVAINEIQNIFAPHKSLGYKPPTAESLVTLVDRLTNAIPPVLAKIDPDGNPELEEVDIAQLLYAGWVYWIGRDNFAGGMNLDFLNVNKLCDQALLQQIAINAALDAGVP